MIKDNKFDSEILSALKENKIKPKAKWTFLLKDYVVWGFGLVSLLFGAFSVAIIIYLLKNNDWKIYTELSGSFLEFVILSMPYLWILVLVTFILLINYNIKHTKKGYKFSLSVLLGSTIAISVVLGALFSSVGLGRALDDVLGENVVFYDRVMNPMVLMWNQPENGRLGGLVASRINDVHYQLIDIEENKWVIDLSRTSADIIDLQINHSIKLIGEQQDEFYFVVERILGGNRPCRAMMRSRLKESPDEKFRLPERCGAMEGVCDHSSSK